MHRAWLYGKTIAPPSSLPKKGKYRRKGTKRPRARPTVIFIPFDWNNSGVDWLTRLCFRRLSFHVRTRVAVRKSSPPVNSLPLFHSVRRAGGCGCIFIAALLRPTDERRYTTSANARFNYSGSSEGARIAPGKSLSGQMSSSIST